ncbi:hypothetical protein J7382_15680 [Shimia sp. R11_0]|uniref:Uncharacterized protein n=1 Tax=Shimia marina TaxID=321267 RepID=A0A0P1FD48_9RHOB|nr:MULTISPECIES: hypothetical protein [Shimia]MBO9478988.1 hypothetical protein [Shimia sp. R11_0]CUH53161.1 hypothetical protein SHM7688_02613 [Shimia marina]SFD83297.1 hypothetical protein SAMN04488037_102660 [Shimia marina]
MSGLLYGDITWREVIAVLLISLTHIGATPFLKRFPKVSRWLLDFSSGIGLGYAFLYLLPKIAVMTQEVAVQYPDFGAIFEHQLYMYLMAGFLIYYLVDFKQHDNRPARFALTLNAVSFATYNVLIGITITHFESDFTTAYAVAVFVFSIHLFGVNSFLHREYPKDFARWMAPLFMTGMYLGCILGNHIEKGHHYQSVATAVVGGIIIILSIRLKLPPRARVNVVAFLIGVACAAAATAGYMVI